MATVKAAGKASQWWFHIYNSLEQFKAREEGQELNGRYSWTFMYSANRRWCSLLSGEIMHASRLEKLIVKRECVQQFF